jgi:hypothetical protein
VERFRLGWKQCRHHCAGKSNMLSDTSGFPGREFSHQILTGAWPGIESTDLRLQGDQEAQAAKEVRDAADRSRGVANDFLQIGAGRFTDATHRGYMSDAALQDAKADFHAAYDKTLNSAADKIDSAKSRLEHIDWQAHEEISQLRQAGSSSAALENAIVLAAHTAAMAHSTAVGAEIGGLGKDLAGHTAPVPGEHEIPGSAYPGKMFREGLYASSPNDDHIFAVGNGDGEDAPHGRGSDRAGSEHGSSSGGENSTDSSRGDGTSGTNQEPSEHAAGEAQNHQALPGVRGDDRAGSVNGVSDGPAGSGSAGPAGLSPLTGALPGAGGGSSGGGSGGGSGLLGGGSSGLSSAFQSGRGVPTSGAAGLGSGPGSGGLGGLTQGVGTPGGGAAGGAPVNPAGEFARNFSAAAMSSPPPAVPQPASAPPTSPPSGAGAPGPAAPISSSAPPAAAGSVAPPVSPMQGVMGGAPPPPPVGSASAGGAGLAPVGSEVARHVGGSPGPATAPAGNPTPAGVAASGASGAAGGAATASMTTGLDPTSRGRASNRGHEVIPDQHLFTAIQLVYELMYGSRVYQGGIEWCVGVFLTPGGAPETVVTSNEGAGYVPAGVFLPRSARLLFVDPLADDEFRETWFGRANPVATMVAYAELRRREDGTLPLYAVAAGAMMSDTTNLGPAEEAGVEYVHLCHPNASPYKGSTEGDQVLDAAHMHRLELADRPLLRWLRSPDRSMGELVARCGRLTTAAFEAVSARLGDSGLMVPDIGAGIYNRLEYSSGDITDAQWEELHAAIRAAEAESGALRPQDDSSMAAAMYRPRHDLARLLELLYWWKPQGEQRSILFMEIAYAARQLVDSE